MTKRVIVWVIMGILLIMVFTEALCREQPIPAPKQDVTEQMPPLSKQLTVDLYLDNTASMQGFVNPGNSTIYAKTVQALESAAISSWPSGQITFSKFGTNIVKLQRPEFLKAVFPYFYNAPDTNIEKVIEATNKNNLTVIVTDLFQKEADATLLIGKLNQRCIQEHLAIGVLGIKSEFKGRIYDADIYANSFDYNSGTTEPKRFRPFYLLLLGKHADVAYYYEKLAQNGLKGFSNTQYEFVIISPYIVNPLPAFGKSKIKTIKKMVEVRSIIKVAENEKRLRQFCLRAPECYFQVEVKYNPLPYTLSFDEQDILPLADFTKLKPQKQSIPIEVGDFVEKSKTSDGTLAVTMKFSSADWPGKGIYLFDLVLSPSLNAYKKPAWFSGWDMNNGYDGTKTLNLDKFLSDLWQTNWQVHQPKIAHFYSYIEKR